MKDIKELIRNVPDFPEPGIIFRDITPLLNSVEGITELMYEMHDKIPFDFNKIVAIESRGFILGSMLAGSLSYPLVLARKPGKLPNPSLQKKYKLEYGEAALCIQNCDINKEDRILIVDDVLATGGTAKTTIDIIEALGGTVTACYFLIELDQLNGRKLLMDKDIEIISSVHF